LLDDEREREREREIKKIKERMFSWLYYDHKQKSIYDCFLIMLGKVG
jgi:hypothetical protein